MKGAVLSREDPADSYAAGEDAYFHSCPFPHATRRVLVLNRNWQAVNIVNVRRAFSLLFREDAKVISTENQATYDIMEWMAHSQRHPPTKERDSLLTVRFPVRIPDVLILADYDRLPMKEVRLSRENIFSRDEYTCQYCGKKFPESELNIDHVIPRERGGRNTWENLVTSCLRCNGRKANRLPHEAGMHLQRKPRHPPRLPFAATAMMDGVRCPEWNSFLPMG